MNRKPFDRKRVAAHLTIALDQVTAALIAVGDLPSDPGDEALDEVLRIHRGVIQSRKVFRTRLNTLLTRVRSEADRQAVLSVEEAANAVGWNSADAGFRLGILNGWATGRVERDRARKRSSRLSGKFPGKPQQ